MIVKSANITTKRAGRLRKHLGSDGQSQETPLRAEEQEPQHPRGVRKSRLGGSQAGRPGVLDEYVKEKRVRRREICKLRAGRPTSLHVCTFIFKIILMKIV